MTRLRSPAAAWDAADPARRNWLAVGVAMLIAVALLLGAAPLTRAIDRATDEVARSRLVLEIARARIAESESLARASAPVYAGDVRAAVERRLAGHALQSTPVAAANTNEGRYAVVVPRGRLDALATALAALSRDDGVRLVEGTITGLVDPGVVRAELTFGR